MAPKSVHWGAEVFHADMAKLKTAFPNLLNVPNYAVSDLEVRGSSWNNYGYLKRKVKMKHPFSLSLQPIVCGSAKLQTELVRICKRLHCYYTWQFKGPLINWSGGRQVKEVAIGDGEGCNLRSRTG
jgi:hypothetical protein